MSVNSTSSDGPDIHQLSATGLGTFTDTSIIQESDLGNTIPSPATDITDAPDTPAFHVISGGSAKGSDLLVERNGYRFVKDGKPNRNDQQRWRCRVRTRSVKCLASVMQNGDEFKRDAQSHSCTPKEAAIHTAKIKAHLKEEGKARPFASAATLVKEALQHHLPSDAPTTTLPCMGALIRSTNRHRQIRRPKHPTDLSFEWVDEALPDILIQLDLRVGAARHVVMFTSFLLNLLKQAKPWYVDATFKAVKKPFQQLWNIHAFVQQADAMKQIPLVFVLMSRRMKDDYISVLNYLQGILVTSSLQCVVMDFEVAVWSAFRFILPEMMMRGCSFHWGQAISQFQPTASEGTAPPAGIRSST